MRETSVLSQEGYSDVHSGGKAKVYWNVEVNGNLCLLSRIIRLPIIDFKGNLWFCQLKESEVEG